MGDQLRIDEDDGLAEWEAGLPSVDQLASLSLSLVPADLASAFRIWPETLRTAGDVNRASQSTLTSIRDVKPVSDGVDDCCELDEQEGSDPKKSRVMNPIDEEAGRDFMNNQSTDVAEKAVKKSRLVWTPQLHKRFVEVVVHLGSKNAVPKTIMQLMNVEGLTRENVASHLQKYRLYVKRMQGWSNEGRPTSDHLFASCEATSNGGGPIHGNGNENRLHNIGESGNHEASNGRIPTQMPYPLPPHFTPVPIMAMAAESVNSGYHGIQQQYNNMMMMQQQQRGWPGNMYNSNPYHAMNQNQSQNFGKWCWPVGVEMEDRSEVLLRIIGNMGDVNWTSSGKWNFLILLDHKKLLKIFLYAQNCYSTNRVKLLLRFPKFHSDIAMNVKP